MRGAEMRDDRFNSGRSETHCGLKLIMRRTCIFSGRGDVECSCRASSVITIRFDIVTMATIRNRMMPPRSVSIASRLAIEK